MEKQFPSIILAGICLTGKSTLAQALKRSGLPVHDCIEGDDLHTEASIGKMRSGQPLDEGDRQAWKERIGEVIAGRPPAGYRIITCSALKRAFRDDLRRYGGVCFVFLVFERAHAEKRARKRLENDPSHFFQPATHPALLDGQYRDLEAPGADENDCLLIDLDAYPTGEDGPEVDYEALAQRVSQWVQRLGPA